MATELWLRLRQTVAVVVSLAVFVSCASRGPGGGATPSPYPIATGDYPMHGHAADYSWIAGTVERDLACVYLDFGERRRSQWGGRIALDAAPWQEEQLHQGDAVVVKGELSRLSYGWCGAPSYIVDSIEEH